MWQPKFFQKQENTVKVGARSPTTKRSWEHRDVIKLLGLPPDLAGEDLAGEIPSLGSWLTRASGPWSTWFPAKYGDGCRLLCGDWKEKVIGRRKFNDVQLMLPRSKVLCQAEERREMYAEPELITNILWSTSCSYFSTCTCQCMWNAQTFSSKTNTELFYVTQKHWYCPGHCQHKTLSFSSQTPEQTHK